MLRKHYSTLAALGGVCAALACANVLGIEDADCDPEYARDCLPDNAVGNSVGNGGSAQTAVPPLQPSNGGNAGQPGASPGAAGAGGGVGSAGSPGSGGAAGSPGAMAGSAGSSSMGVDPVVARASALCLEYCDTIARGCTGMNQQYASPQACLSVCELMEPGVAGAPGTLSGNNVRCRLDQAQFAADTGEAALYCAAAGPGGSDACGRNCDGYCTVMTAKCAREIGNLNQCLAACSIVPDLSLAVLNPQRYNVSMQSGDSIQCRLFHVSASTLDPALHCVHAAGQMPCL